MKAFKAITVLMGMLAVLSLVSAPVEAALINFDSLAPGAYIDGIDLGGATFSSLPDAKTMVVNNYGVGWTSPYNAITNFGIDGTNFIIHPLYITFDSIQSSVSLTGGDEGGDRDKFKVTAYNSSNVEIGSYTTPEFGGSATLSYMADSWTVNMNIDGIKSLMVQAYSIGGGAGIGIDDVQFCQVPVPPSLLLFAPGLLGLIGWRRRS
jgi:hypothetical protein